MFVSEYAKTVKDRNNLRKLLTGDENSFLSNWKAGSDYYSAAIRDTVINALGGKTEALQRMKDFVRFLRRKGIEIESEWPPIDDIGNRFERIVYIMREMQTANEEIKKTGKKASVYLAEKLWVSDRTIDEDFSYMEYPDIYKPDLFEQSLVINGMVRTKKEVWFESTAHPFFLIENLTSLRVLFESLLEKAARHLPYQEQAMITASRIWKQLTAYAQGRITSLLKDTYPENGIEMQLFDRMRKSADKEKNAFIVEGQGHKNPSSYLLDAVKFGVPCRIEYKSSGWEVSEWTGSLKIGQIRNFEALILEKEKLEIPFDNIVSVTLLEK